MSKGQVIAESAIQFVRLLPAPPDTAWAFLTEPARVAEWYGEGVIEAHEGGKVELMGGHIRGVVTGWRLREFFAHTWNVFAPGETVSGWPVSYLEFALVPKANQTRLTLTHRPIPERMQPQTMMGWHTFLDMLEAATSGRRVGPRSDTMKKNATLYGVDLDNLQR